MIQANDKVSTHHALELLIGGAVLAAVLALHHHLVANACRCASETQNGQSP